MTLISFILNHRRIALLFHILPLLAVLPGILQMQSDNSPQVFFSRDAIALDHYQQFREKFGGGHAVRITVSGKEIWTKQGLIWLGQLEKETAGLRGVESVVGLAARHQWMLMEWPPPDPISFRKEVVEKGLDIGAGWVSLDGNTVTIVVMFSQLTKKDEGRLLHQLEHLTAQPPPGISSNLSGLPVVRLAMDRSLLVMASRFLPLLGLMAILFLAIVFRRFHAVIVPMAFVGVSQAFLFGIMGYAGARLNLINIILAPLIFVITLATVVHIQIRFRRLVQDGLPVHKAIYTTYRAKRWPVIWTGMTTFIAFGSLVTAGLPPVQSLGLWAAIGIVIMTLLVFTFCPILLSLAGANATKEKRILPFETGMSIAGGKLARWAVKRRRIIVMIMAILMGLGAWGISHLYVEDNIGEYFPDSHPVRMELKRLQQEGIGVFAAELIITSPVKKNNNSKNAEDEADSGYQNPDGQLRLHHLATQLRSHPLVLGAISSGDLVEASIQSVMVDGKADDDTRWLAIGFLQTVPGSRKLFHALQSVDGETARITLLLPMLSFNRTGPLFEQVKSNARKAFPNAEIFITGQYPLILLAQETLLRGLMLSLSVTLLCVVIIFWLLLRSTRLTIRVLLPNVWPVILVLGGMGWLNISLDSVSVMTASIVLGLSVDDTFHSLGYFLRLRRHYNAEKSLEVTLFRTAPAHVLTSAILVAGFTACSLSQFLPVSRMGLFSAVAITLALLGDLILIPALLSHKELLMNSGNQK